MSKLPRACPKCRTPLAPSPAQQNGKIRCPECGAVIASVRDDDADVLLQAKPSNARPALRAVTKARRQDDAPDRFARKGNGSLVGLICVVLGVGFLGLICLILIGGGIGLWLTLRSAKTTTVAVVEADDAAIPIVAPVANPDGGLALGNPPPVQPQQPLPPPKEPIKPVAQGDGRGAATGELPLDELKAATVYIKATTATMGATGSGFVLRAQGDTVWVVTNHHVVTPPPEALGPGRPPIGRRPVIQAGVDLTVVFHSGTQQEQSVKAVLVGDDKDADLAVLKVTGVKDSPAPIDSERSPKLRETMPVLAFGFPFGAALDPTKKNPALTVTKGTVSSLRLDRGEVSDVQLDLDLNPGNSGGPVVDERGILIGVAVAKVKNSRIGFAVPVHKLHRLMEGRIETPTTLQTLNTQGRSQVRVVAHVADPLGKLRSPTLLYGRADEMKMPVYGKDGWEGLVGANSSPMQLEGSNAVAVLALEPPAKGEMKIIVQASFQNAAGQTVHGEPKTLTLGNAQAAPPVVATPIGPAKGEDLTKLLADLKSPDEATRQRAADALMKWPPKERLQEVKQSLEALLSSPEAATRTAGVKALAACDPKEVPPALPKLLADEAPAVRQAVLHVLKDRKDARYAEAVAARLLTDGGAAADALKAMGLAAEKAVLPYLTDPNPQVRGLAFQVIKEIGAAASVPALEEAIRANGPDAASARNALESVRERVPLGKDEWVQVLDDLRSANANRRAKAVRRISITLPLDDRRADIVPRLETLLQDRAADIRSAAARGLVRWAGKDSVPVLAQQLDGLDPGWHAVVMDALAELKDEATAAAAIAKRVLQFHDHGRAIQALKAMDQSIAEKAVLALLADANDFNRAEICKALKDIGGRDSIAPLEQLEKNKNIFYSGLATQALTAIKARVENDDKK
jgi:HEAT repeat protein